MHDLINRTYVVMIRTLVEYVYPARASPLARIVGQIRNANKSGIYSCTSNIFQSYANTF